MHTWNIDRGQVRVVSLRRPFAGALLCACCAVGQTPRDHDIVAEDYFSIGVILDSALSPDGKFVAYVESRWEPPAESRNPDIWVVNTSTKEVRRLTFEAGSDASPQWGPDSRWIYFTAARKHEPADAPYNGKTQVWRISVEGGEPQPVTRLAEGVGAFQLSADGKSLYYTQTQKNVDDPWRTLKEKYDKLEYGHGVDRFSQIWKLDLVNWRAAKIVDDNRVITAFTVTRDERRIAMITAPAEATIHNEGWSRLDIYDAATRKVSSPADKPWRADAPSPYGWLISPAWSDDGQALAFRIDFDGYPGEIHIAQFSDGPDAPRTWKLLRPHEVTLGAEHMEWIPGTHDLCFMAQDHARERMYRIMDVRDGKQGAADMLTPGEICADGFSVAQSGDRAAVVLNTLTDAQDIYMASVSGDAARMDQLTHINPQIDTWKLPRIQVVDWKAPDGTKVEGILELPPDAKEGQKLPTVVEIHGGPTACVRYCFQFWIYGRTLLPARGWALLSPNYRGSTGYGDKFLTDLVGRENDIEVNDILSGVDSLVAKGVADPDRLAVMGWSNGGYLTNCLITHTTRFKAASSGAGIVDETLQWLAEDTPGHVVNFMQGFPWSQADAMRRASALYALDKIKTPTIIHVGGSDERCPPEHSRGLYRALHQYLHVPCELVVYPGEPHGLTKYTSRKAKMDWDIAWLDKYVLDQNPDPAARKTPSEGM